MARKLYFEKSKSKMGPKKEPQALRWLENSMLKIQSPKMDLQTAPQALRWLENSTLKNQSPKMGPQKAPQALRWLENGTLKSPSPKMGPQKAPQALRWLEKTCPAASGSLAIFQIRIPQGILTSRFSRLAGSI